MPPERTLSVSIAPAWSLWLCAPKTSSNRFSMITEMPNVTSKRRQQPAAQGQVQQAALQDIAEREHHRHDDEKRRDRMHARSR